MKAALCFSGKLGDWKGCVESIVQNIIVPLRPDIFLTTWHNEDYQQFAQLYNPTRWRVLTADQATLDNLIFDCVAKPSAGLVPMLYNMYACNGLRLNFEKQNNIKS